MKAPRLAAALLAPLLLFTACGDDGVVEAGGTDVALARLQAAPDAMAEAGSGRFEMTMSFEAMGERVEMTATGAFAGERATMTMDLGSALAGLAESSGEPMPPGFDEPMTIVVDGTTTYLRMPMLTMLTGTDGWLSLSAEEMGLAEGGFGMGFSGPTSDPTQILESLRGISDEIEVVGTETVRGVTTTRYRVVVDLDAAAADLPEEARQAFEDEMADLGVSTLPLEVWAAEDGLVYRMAIDLGEILAQVPDDEVSGAMAGQMVMELFDYGADVDIEVPDPAEVTPFSEVSGGFGFDPSTFG